jgi:hypothetical protein
MKPTTIITTLLTLALPGAQAGCYTSGDTWPNKEEARSFVENACKGANGMFTGDFAARQTKSMCPRSGSKSLGLQFEVQNLNANTAFNLGDQDCYDRLNNEIFGCDHGGESTVAGWRFR